MNRPQRDENRSLRRQSLTIAGVVALADGIPWALYAATHPHPAVWVAGAAILAVDLALALPARTSARVAVAHAVVRCGVAALLWATTGVRDNGTANATGLVISAYRAGAWVQGRRSRVVVAVLVLGMAAALALQGVDELGLAVLVTLTNTALPWLVGRYTTGRSGYIDEIERRAESDRQAARQALALAVAEERGAIARDLHDTISHHVSAVGVHAAAARLGMGAGRPPEMLAGTLRQVETESLAAMADLRRMLDLLHAAPDESVRQPGLDNLAELVDATRSAGLAVRVDLVDVRPDHLPGSVDVAAYRVVAELLTNAQRHGDGSGAVLELRQDAGTLVVTVLNGVPDTPRPSPGTGRGIDGVRHRVAMFGGTVTSGPGPDGRTWSTTATFPLQERP